MTVNDKLKPHDKRGNLVVEFTEKPPPQTVLYVIGEVARAIARQCIEKPSLRELVESMTFGLYAADGRLYGICIPTNVSEEDLQKIPQPWAIDGPDVQDEAA